MAGHHGHADGAQGQLDGLADINRSNPERCALTRIGDDR